MRPPQFNRGDRVWTSPAPLNCGRYDIGTVERRLEAGGQDNGAPGERPYYHPGYYAAFLLDPDGNNLEAVHHGDANRSSASVKITF